MAQLINPKVIKEAFSSYRAKYNYIADEILTLVPIKNRGGLYKVYDRFSLKPEDDIVGDSGAKIVEDTIRDVTMGSYSVIERGFTAFIKDKDRENLDEAGLFDLVQEKVGGIKEKLLLNKEIRVASLINGSGNSTTPSTKWDGSNPTIEKDIENAIEAFENSAGIAPNMIIIPKAVWKVMKLDSTLRDVWKIIPATADKEKIKLSSLLKILFENFDKILIPNSKKDTAKKGKSASYSDIWTNDTVILLYAEEKGTTDTFTWGANYRFADTKETQWRENDPAGVKVKIFYEADEKVVCSNAIYKLTNVLT